MSLKEQDIRDWLRDPVTIDFMKRVDFLKNDCDNGVHVSIEKNEMDEARAFNAGMKQLEEVLLIPELIIDEEKEEEEE